MATTASLKPSPFADGTVGGDQRAAAVVARADELEEQMRGIGLEGQMAKIINDQQLGAWRTESVG
jgi:hypothetical protein